MSAAVDHGYLPSGKYIINHDIMHCTADGVAGNHLYSGRALGMSESDDIIQLHPELKPLWHDITTHYGRIGLTHTQNVIWNIQLDQLGKHVSHFPSVFYFGPHECRNWGDHEWLGTVEYINSKNNFIEVAQQLGVEIPQTLCFDSVNLIDAEVMSSIQFPCYLKAAISVSGVGIYRCEDKESFIRAMASFGEDTPVQVQAEVISETFLNMQYRVVNGYPVRLACSEQVLDGFAHQGNTYPARYEPWEMIDPMAFWLAERGMKGIFAFDVAVVETPSGVAFPAIECNPRYNGASYPTVIAQKLDIPEWTAKTFSTRHRNLADIDLKDIEFNMTTGEGAIIVNWGTVLVGKLVILMAGSREYRDVLEAELKSRL
jgi:hypothetical protein